VYFCLQGSGPMDTGFLRIEPLFNTNGDHVSDSHLKIVSARIRELLDNADGVGRKLHERLPLLNMSECQKIPGDVSFHLICRSRASVFKFFFEMVSRWLIPDKLLNVVLLHALDFQLPEFSNDIFTFCEMKVRLEQQEDMKQLLHNFPIVKSEISLGLDSAYRAMRILEVKGVGAEEKIAMVHDHIARLVKRLPQHFDDDVFAEAQHVLLRCGEKFRSVRKARHISKIISIHYLFRKEICQLMKKNRQRRYLSLKLVRAHLHHETETKKILGIIVGVNFLRDKEFFEKRHLLKAIRNFVPDVKAVEDSFFEGIKDSHNIYTLYLEIEKNEGLDFTSEEVKRLQEELPNDLKDRIEQLVHPVFMPCNEEEIMRNILSLSNQVKYLRDIPQVIITFDQQTDLHLKFTVIYLRIVKPGMLPVRVMFQKTKTPLEYKHDRCRTLGHIRKRYPKEVTVFRVKLHKDRFLRRDHSIDLYRARRFVVGEMTRILGEFRDFNGGIISKQDELLRAVRSLLAEDGLYQYNDLLLENLFYSLTPVIMRSVLAPAPLKTLFLMLTNVVKNEEHPVITSCEESGHFIVIAKLVNPAVKDRITDAVAKLDILPTTLATAFVSVRDTPSLSYIFQCDDASKQELLFRTIKEAIYQEAELPESSHDISSLEDIRAKIDQMLQTPAL